MSVPFFNLQFVPRHPGKESIYTRTPLIVYAKSVVSFLGGIITNPVDPQPTQGKNLCYDLLPVQYTELTQQVLRTFLDYLFVGHYVASDPPNKLHYCKINTYSVPVSYKEMFPLYVPPGRKCEFYECNPSSGRLIYIFATLPCAYQT